MSSISGWDRITCQWNNDDVRSVLDKHAQLGFYNGNNSPRVKMTRH